MKINKKGEITAMQVITGIVLLSMVSAGLFGFMQTLVVNYEPDGAPQISVNETENYARFNILDKLNSTAMNLDKTLRTNDEKINPLQFFILVPKAIWGGMVILFTLPAFILELIFAATNILPGIPSWVLLGVNVLVSALISLLILSAIIKWKMQ